MLEDITPLILTWNEGPNIQRTLECLAWAKDIVVVDSFSDDDTLAIVSASRKPGSFSASSTTMRVNGTLVCRRLELRPPG